MLYAFKLVAIALITIPAALFTILVGLIDPYGKRAYEITRIWTWIILTVGGLSLKINGISHIEPKQQYVFIVNHQSNIDIPVLVQSLTGFQLRWLAKKELLWVPFFGWAMWAGKHIAVNRSERFHAAGSLRRAKELMESGISVVFFPEGTRSPDGKLLPFKRGGFLLAVKTQTAVVPITINGSGALLPKGDWRIRGGEIEVTVGEPVSVKNYRPGSLRAISAQVQELIGQNLRMASQLARETSGRDQPATAAQPSMEKRSV